jgi:hypothetical protein
MVQRRAARYVQNNYHNTSSVTSMIDILGWPTLAERRLKTRLIMLFKITHALIAIPNIILIPTDSRTRKSYNQTFTSGFDICKFLLKYPRDLFPFEVILSMWVFHLRFDCSATPRYFAEVTCLISNYFPSPLSGLKTDFTE